MKILIFSVNSQNIIDKIRIMKITMQLYHMNPLQNNIIANS